jgi:hypothetical protein
VGLETKNIGDDKVPAMWKLLLKSFFASLPFMVLNCLMFSLVLNVFRIHKLIIAKSISLKIIAMIISISNPFMVGFILFLVWIFWFNIYFLTNRLIMSDILSGTRVTASCDVDYKVDKDGSIVIRPEGEVVLNIGDKVIKYVENLNSFLGKKLAQVLRYLKLNLQRLGDKFKKK